MMEAAIVKSSPALWMKNAWQDHGLLLYQPGKTCGCDMCLTVVLLVHDGSEKIQRSTILFNRQTELLQKCRHMRKFSQVRMKGSSPVSGTTYECPEKSTGREEEIQWQWSGLQSNSGPMCLFVFWLLTSWRSDRVKWSPPEEEKS